MTDQTPYASLLIPPLGQVQVPPTFHTDDCPQVVFLSEEAKSVKFKLDPTALRMVVYPCGRIDSEY